MPDLGINRQLVETLSAQLIGVAPEVRAGKDFLAVDDDAFASPVADSLRRAASELVRLSDAIATLTDSLGQSAHGVAEQLSDTDRALASAGGSRQRAF